MVCPRPVLRILSLHRSPSRARRSQLCVRYVAVNSRGGKQPTGSVLASGGVGTNAGRVRKRGATERNPREDTARQGPHHRPRITRHADGRWVIRCAQCEESRFAGNPDRHRDAARIASDGRADPRQPRQSGRSEVAEKRSPEPVQMQSLRLCSRSAAGDETGHPRRSLSATPVTASSIASETRDGPTPELRTLSRSPRA
jgi:hypothetical protein